ncbi:hypothetical protein ACQKMN_07325 [Ureibacillus composti]
MSRIVVFSRVYSLAWVKQVTSLDFKHVDFTFVSYDSLVELKDLFIEKIQQVDGIIFSGQIPYFYIQNHFPDIQVPMLHFDISAEDFYRVLSEELYRNKEFQMQRCTMDFIYEENDYLGLKEWVRADEFPQLFTNTIQIYDSDDIYDEILDYHLKVWNTGKIDVCMTRLTNLPQLLKPYGIKPIVIHPSQKSMKEKIETLLKIIKLNKLIENQVVIGHLELNKNSDNVADLDYRQMSLHKAILDFGRINKIKFIIHRNALYFEIITSYSDFKEITNDMTKCNLALYLTNELRFPVQIGWGIGHSIQDAQLSAQKAAANNKSPVTEAYVFTKEGQLVGPLGQLAQLEISTQTDPTLDELSSKLRTSSLQLQKVKAIMAKLQTNLLSAEDLSSHLGITDRAASRILKKLEEQGAATASLKQQKRLRGRPKKVYTIHFDDLI